jgi:hypothetical protein
LNFLNKMVIEQYCQNQAICELRKETKEHRKHELKLIELENKLLD